MARGAAGPPGGGPPPAGELVRPVQEDDRGGRPARGGDRGEPRPGHLDGEGRGGDSCWGFL